MPAERLAEDVVGVAKRVVYLAPGEDALVHHVRAVLFE